MSFALRIRKLASETAIYGVSSVVGRLISFLLFPFYSQVFSPDEYGIVAVVFTLFIFFNVVYQYGMEAAYLKFASASREADSRTTTFSTAVWSLAATSVVLSAGLLLFRNGLSELIFLEPAWRGLLYYVALILVLDTLAVVPFAELRLQNRPIRFATIRVANVLVNVGMNVFLILGLGMGVEAVFIANAAASAVAVLLLAPTYWSLLRIRFSRVLWMDLLRFGLPFLPAGLGYAFTDRVNIFFLKSMSRESVLDLYGDLIEPAQLAGMTDPAQFGSYAAGVFNGVTKLAIFMALVVQMFRYAWQPFFLQHAEDDDARPLFARIFTLFTAACLFVLLSVSFLADDLVALPLPGGRSIVEQSYWLGLFVVPISLLGYMFQGWYYNFAAGAYIRKTTSYFIYCAAAGAGVALLVNGLFVPKYGMLAAAWATASAYITMAGVLFVLMRREYPIPYQWARVALMGIIAAACFAAHSFIPALRTWYAEFALLLLFALSLVPTRVVPLSALRSVLPRKPA